MDRPSRFRSGEFFPDLSLSSSLGANSRRPPVVATGCLGSTPYSSMVEDTLSGSLHSAPKESLKRQDFSGAPVGMTIAKGIVAGLRTRNRYRLNVAFSTVEPPTQTQHSFNLLLISHSFESF